jgi:hypothetical protein
MNGAQDAHVKRELLTCDCSRTTALLGKWGQVITTLFITSSAWYTETIQYLPTLANFGNFGDDVSSELALPRDCHDSRGVKLCY